MKVIFLDNDGVICLYNNWGGRKSKWKKYRKENPDATPFMADAPVEYRFDNFDEKAVKILNQILKETGAEIVVSSDWRLHATLEELGDYYIAHGISKRPIAVTPIMEEFDSAAGLFRYKGWDNRIRIVEIKKWLSENSVESWVAIDDLDMTYEEYSNSEENNGGLTNFVLTPRTTEGIKQSGIKEKIIQFLNGI
jgi:hypothetical protein